VLGRTLEHFGVQMYKRREIAITELVANSWDALAKNVAITIPDIATYSKDVSTITIQDDGEGMTFDEIRDHYLVMGRNRRKEGGLKHKNRAIMGRKGVGKLAGFGLADTIEVFTWKDGVGLKFTLILSALKADDNQAADILIPWSHVDSFQLDALLKKSKSGTKIVLSKLRHKTPIDHQLLETTLSRRFTRSVKGLMQVQINESPIKELDIDLIVRVPPEKGKLATAVIGKNKIVKYWYGFARDTIKTKELRGFAIQVHGKTAQAPPFFFDVEATASNQHSTRYTIGEIEADYLDNSIEDDTDLVSTDRQEIDWNTEETLELLTWGQQLTRKALTDCGGLRGKEKAKDLLKNVELHSRIDRLEQTSQNQIFKFINIIGGVAEDDEQATHLVNALVQAYEYKSFVDVTSEIESCENDPDRLRDMLVKLAEWKLLESRAILEIIKGRLGIISKFEYLVLHNTAETAHKKGADNLHDLIGRFPWLLDPKWQLLDEEKTITKQINEWANAGVSRAKGVKQDVAYAGRYDFLALSNESDIVIIEIKRSGHPLDLAEYQRVHDYISRLRLAHDKAIAGVILYGGKTNMDAKTFDECKKNDAIRFIEWSKVCENTRKIYKNYKEVLERDVTSSSFDAVKREVSQTRAVLASGSAYRDKDERRQSRKQLGK
jgi:hypothetical protein